MILGKIRRRLFGISPEETSTERRGFTVTDPAIRGRLETIGESFAHGYHLALLNPQPAALAAALEKMDPELCGFAYEGAGMGLALLDLLAPWPSRYLLNFLHGPGQPHAYMIQIGVGWALARLKRPVEGWLQRLDPVVNWLLLDGYGFHETFFSWPQVLEEQVVPKRLIGYARNGFDQGVGRALWFVKGANPDRVAAAINAFPATRHNDIWSGVGLASAYAGGVAPDVIEELIDVAGTAHRAPLAQGAVFAASTRLHAGNSAPHVAMACEMICGLSVAEAAELFDRTAQDLPANGASSAASIPAFEVWRQRIQQNFQVTNMEVAA